MPKKKIEKCSCEESLHLREGIKLILRCLVPGAADFPMSRIDQIARQALGLDQLTKFLPSEEKGLA